MSFGIMFRAAYIELYYSGELQSRIAELEKLSRECSICPHGCKIDRFSTNKGKCNTAVLPQVSSASPHFGEEPPLVGIHGSGTIFMTNCNLSCIFCQNYDISQLGHGQEISYEQLADAMIHLQERGCHNINFVTPTHQVYAILRALELAIPRGLKIPLVYNSGGYDLVSTLKILDGIFDIYMPDFKYFDSDSSLKFSGIINYPNIVKEALHEMHRQVGDLKLSSGGIAERGLIVRHLALPGYSVESKSIIDFIYNLSVDTYFNLMDQYRPAYKAIDRHLINRRLSPDEFSELIEYANKKGIRLAE
jgi:putative pyruvate formate lyase activating enzyme